MGTLYELLGALPGDDAEELRAAFRKAAKATHPDLNPDNPDAPQRFRELVRAYDILTDKEQRTTYDHLLAIALQPETSPKPPRNYEAMHKVASNTMAATIILAVLVGGYTLFGHFSDPPVAAEMPDGAQQVAMLPVEEASSRHEKDGTTVGMATAVASAPQTSEPAPAPIGRFEPVAPFVTYNLGVPSYPRFTASTYFAPGIMLGRSGDPAPPLINLPPPAAKPPATEAKRVRSPVVAAAAAPVRRQPLMIVPTIPERRMPITAAVTP